MIRRRLKAIASCHAGSSVRPSAIALALTNTSMASPGWALASALLLRDGLADRLTRTDFGLRFVLRLVLRFMTRSSAMPKTPRQNDRLPDDRRRRAAPA